MMGGLSDLRRGHRHLSALSCLTILATPGTIMAQGARTEPYLANVSTRIDALVRPQADAGLFSGTILVARAGQILFERSYGYASWELGVPNSAHTRFGIASVTKAMTEVLVRVMTSHGRLDLDSPVEEYLPGFPRGPEGGVPTVRQLLEHRAGVPHRVTDALERS